MVETQTSQNNWKGKCNREVGYPKGIYDFRIDGWYSIRLFLWMYRFD